MSKFTRFALITLFFFSGFSGLIYESIWSHYLRLFLGHAAYAQTLVLIIFMGGVALGSWLSARFTRSHTFNLLLLYALVEGLIGLIALVFHPLFVNITHFSFAYMIPALHSPLLVNMYKWTLGGLLLAPQSILLGATFPLMTAGLIRLSHEQPGHPIATLYFINSLGAVFGVLTSGFFLIKTVGLPGTMFTAGIINLVIAGLVCLLITCTKTPDNTQAIPKPSGTPVPLYQMLLIIALLTGTSSFIYEIVWIRMLSLVLSSSTHAFELMLSAFILGLALGGLAIRNKIDSLMRPIQMLAKIQLIMGILAASTVFLYNHCFQWMVFIFNTLPKDDMGYVWFNLSSHLLASLVMLPTTFCAGMTLPLITKILLDKNDGDSAIGYVYAVNTLGAIVGVILAIHLLLPLMGLKNALLSGAAIDIVLAIILIQKAEHTSLSTLFSYLLIGFGFIAIAIRFTSFNPIYMASGVYRYGSVGGSDISLYHRDGKTASVDVIRLDDTLTIRTNGKPDASIGLTDIAAPDEPTEYLLAWIPLLLERGAKEVAVIGIGSGLTTHAVLQFPNVKNVDTIEIEPFMVEGAKFFKVSNDIFHDPRSHLFIEDAKSFFTTHQKKYDVIISEPSNPWVSGVANLFSEEFYAHIQSVLNEGGLLVQWIPIYELDDALVGSIFKAMAQHFDDYQLYLSTGRDLVVVARTKGTMTDMHLSNDIFTLPQFKQDLERLNIASPIDLSIRYLGNKTFIAPYLLMFPLPANSDYYPVLDQNAAQTLFKNEDATGLIQISDLLSVLGKRPPFTVQDIMRLRASPYNPIALPYKNALALANRLTSQAQSPHFGEDENKIQNVATLFDNCKNNAHWIDDALWISENTVFYLPPENAAAIWKNIQQLPCFAQLPRVTQTWVNLLAAFAEQNDVMTSQAIETLLMIEKKTVGTLVNNPFFIRLALISHMRQGEYQAAFDIWNHLTRNQQNTIVTQFLISTAIQDVRQ